MRKVNIEEITANLNKARMAAGNREFKRNSELAEFLSQFGIKCSNTRVMAGIKTLLDGNKFPNYPIYVEQVRKTYDKLSKYRKDHRNKTTKEDFSENEAIKFLKERGYKILKPITNYEEI